MVCRGAGCLVFLFSVGFFFFFVYFISGKIEHVSWINVYEAIRAATGYVTPGYLIHEAVRFNPENRRYIVVLSPDYLWKIFVIIG